MFLSVDFILCCGIFTVITAYDFVLIESSVELNSNSTNLGVCVCVCVCVCIHIYIYMVGPG
jgi:hypothetical protein